MNSSIASVCSYMCTLFHILDILTFFVPFSYICSINSRWKIGFIQHFSTFFAHLILWFGLFGRIDNIIVLIYLCDFIVFFILYFQCELK